ncbi:phosphoenolpyruvate--protein phosphotransferase [Candidatus Chloroploca asiatica]|uniref:phosphoenolpyruvate--protein phosphotransferase n=1 Tax=Candidatus Chloroploca asiatica TaxID=1506545 RepID=UPI000BE7B97D|nr:phosphoenolpyruvate--protein phosphotransferase [Candidatus Chloroploca asiatica]
MSTLILHGLAAAPGVALGPALVYQLAEALPTAGSSTATFSVAQEQVRLAKALAQADASLGEHEARLRQANKAEEADIFAAHRMLLHDPSLREMIDQAITEHSLPAPDAVLLAANAQAELLEEIGDDYLRARAVDLRDVARLLERALTGTKSLGEQLSEPAVIVGRDLGPSDLMSVPHERLLGLVLAGGGLTAHSSILARGLGIPAVVGLGETLLHNVATGTLLALDGATGQVYVAPNETELATLRAQATALREQEATLREAVALPTITSDGHAIALVANASTVAEARSAHAWGAAGIGLLRTELLFLERTTLPDETEQLALYAAIAAELPGLPITVRTLDVGGDKHLPAFPLPHEDNPFLGWRGLRIGLSEPDLLLPQLRALLRAGANATIRIMLPMVSTVSEVQQARALLDRARRELDAEGLAYAQQVELGVMIEVPSAALTADALAREVDFFSIGTNDLTQYTLACDRGNQRVATLYQPLHPSVLQLIAMTCTAAHRHGRHVAVCGELGGDPKATALLIGLGVDELSCSPGSIPHVRAAIRATSYADAQALAHQALEAPDAAAVQALLNTVA